jgi:hypothetical protein
MYTTDIRFLHQSAFGIQMPPGCTNVSAEMCERFSADAIRSAFEIAAVQNKPSIAYVMGVLNGNGKKLALVPTATERDRILAANAESCREFAGGGM